jgi:hypothetical protein
MLLSSDSMHTDLRLIRGDDSGNLLRIKSQHFKYSRINSEDIDIKNLNRYVKPNSN